MDAALLDTAAFDCAPGVQVDAFAGQRLGHMGADVLVFDRQDALGHLHHADVCTQGVVETGELDADGAATYNHQTLGYAFWHQRFAVGPEVLAVWLHARQHTGPCAGGKDDVRRT